MAGLWVIVATDRADKGATSRTLFSTEPCRPKSAEQTSQKDSTPLHGSESVSCPPQGNRQHQLPRHKFSQA